MGKTFRSPSWEIKLGEVLAGEQEIAPKVQLIRTGIFYHEVYGKLELTKEHLTSFVKNFQEKVRKIDLAIDYKHDSDDVAAGWIQEIYFDDHSQSLFGVVKWTPQGKKVLIDREFRYLSSEFSMNYQDPESLKEFGPTLLGAGLTNRPFIKGMEPVVSLSETQGANTMGLEQLIALVQQLQAQVAELQKQMQADAAVDQPAQGAPPAPALADLQKQNSDMKAKLAEYEAKEAKLAEDKAAEDKRLAEEKLTADKKVAFDKMLSEKKAVEAQREAWMAGDLIKFSENAVSIKDERLSKDDNGAEVVGDVKDTAEDKVLALAEKLVADKKAKTKSDAVAMVLSDPEHKALREEYDAKFN